MVVKKPKIFISHATKDKDYVSILVNLLEDMGLRESQIFDSTVRRTGRGTLPMPAAGMPGR